jgi:hypothetical protein
LETVTVIKKTANKETFIRITEKKLQDWLKINGPHTKTDNTLFDRFGPLVFFVYCQTNKIFFSKNRQMNIPIKFGSNWPCGFREVD